MNINKTYREWLLSRARRHDAKAAKLRARVRALTPKRRRSGLVQVEA